MRHKGGQVFRQITVLQRHLISSSRGSDGHLCSLQDLQDASPPSLFAPALIATGHRLPGSEAFGKLAPRRTRPHDPQDAFHDQTMLDGGTTGGGLLGQERPQLFPALSRQSLQTSHPHPPHTPPPPHPVSPHPPPPTPA